MGKNSQNFWTQMSLICVSEYLNIGTETWILIICQSWIYCYVLIAFNKYGNDWEDNWE